MANRRDIQRALNNRLELVKAGFTRRDLIKMGLMTSAGVLIPKDGLTHPSDGATVANSEIVRDRLRFSWNRCPYRRS